MSAPVRILTPDDVDDFLRIYELEVELPSWERTAILQGLAMSRDEAAAGAERADHGVAWDVRLAIYGRATGRCEYCTDPVAIRRVGRHRTPSDRELDHMLSRYGLIAVGATAATIHHRANLCSACARCNGEKGTESLGPTDLEAMWTALGVKLDDPAVPLLRFYSQLLEHRRFHIRRFDQIPQRAVQPALGALRRQTPWPTPSSIGSDQRSEPIAGRSSSLEVPPAGSALLRHHPRRLDFVEHELYAEMWARDSASDDNRELWRR